MAVIVPPIPVKTPIANSNGLMNETWYRWLRELYARVGGTSALSNTELADIAATDLTVIQADISTLQSSVATLQNQVTNLLSDINDLNQGPNL